MSSAKTDINMAHLTYIMFIFTPIAFVSVSYNEDLPTKVDSQLTRNLIRLCGV